MAVNLRVEVVDIRADFDQLIGREIGALAPDNYPQYVRPIGEVLGTSAVTNALDFIARPLRRRTRERLQNSRAGGSNHLGRSVAEAHREAGEQFGRRRRG